MDERLSNQELLRRINRNLIVCTSQATWDLFCNQVNSLNISPPVDVFRFILIEALKTFSDFMYENNVEILYRRPLEEPMDAWRAEVGPEGNRIYFELTPYHDRIIFTKKDDNAMMQEVISNPIQVAYPECMYKPLVWIPFTTQVAFDGQVKTDLTDLIGGKK